MHLSILFCATLATTVLARDVYLDYNPLTKFPNISNLAITLQCAEDLLLWEEALLEVSAVSTECIVEQKCSDKEKSIIKNNLWAIRQMDAFGRFNLVSVLNLKIVYEGSYQECEAVSGIKYDTNYCFINLTPGKTNCTQAGLLGIRMAICMPKACNSHDIEVVFKSLDEEIPISACNPHCVHKDVKKDSAFWGFTIFLGIMLIVAIVASVVDFVRESFGKPSHNERNLGLKILVAFSFYTNAGQILSVKEQKEGFIKSLDCIRLFSMSWVVYGHVMAFFILSDELGKVKNFRDPLANHLLTNAVLSVDTFFLLSGIVVSYMFFKTRLKKSVIMSPVTWILYYVHRYLRLTPAIMLFIGVFTVYSPYVQGPFNAASFDVLDTQVEQCKQNWWGNVLYINNFGTLGCYAITWYLAVDTQIYAAMPIFLIALYISFNIGVLTILAGIIGSLTATYILTYEYDISGSMLHSDPSGKFGTWFYSKPWIRCTPYLVGIFIGYILAVYGKRRLRLHWGLSIVVWCGAVAVALACLFGDYDYVKGTADWSKFTRATYFGFYRIGWAIAVSWTVVATHFGWAGPIGNFMSHPIWQPFGRLSYCAYIVHWMMIFVFNNLSDRVLHYTGAFYVYLNVVIPVTLISYFVAFWWSCLFEMSILKLEKMLIEALLRKLNPPKKQEAAVKDTEKAEANTTVTDTSNSTQL